MRKAPNKPVRGTVATTRSGWTDCRLVLREYSKNWGDIPKTFCDARAAELSITAAWALNRIEQLEHELHKTRKTKCKTYKKR